MSTLTARWIPVSGLYLGAQITYASAEYVVLEVLEQPIGGWVVVANAVDDMDSPPRRAALVYGNPVAQAQLAHREVC